MVGSEGVKALSGYKYVSVKLNDCSLISTSYNLNYLEVCGLRADCHGLLRDAGRAYAANKTNFSN
jgi:hypothetical protein